MFDIELLQPQNSCKYTGLEKQRPHIFGKALRIFESRDGTIRLLAYDDTNSIVSGLVIALEGQKRTYTIKGVFTLESYRRQGYARQLLAVARHVIGTVKHSDNLTGAGEQWAVGVEGIYKKQDRWK